MTAPYRTVVYSIYVAVCRKGTVADYCSSGAFDVLLGYATMVYIVLVVVYFQCFM